MITTLAGMILGVVRGVRFRARGRPSAMLAGEAEVYYDERTGAMRVRTEASDSALGGSGGGGTTDHALLASNLAWATSGHTGTASRLAGFGGGGATAYYQIGVDVQAYDADLATIAGLTVTRGAVLYGAAGPVWSALAVGTSGQFLQSNGTDLIWGSIGGGSLGSILTTQGDLMGRDATSPARIPIGADGTVLGPVAGLTAYFVPPWVATCDDIVTILAASSNAHYARSLSVPSVIRLATPNTFPVARTVGAADTEYGWTWLNRAALSSANENTTVSSAFYGAHGATNTDWTTGTYTCPTRYQSIMRGIAPFEVVARLYSNGDANYERSTLLIFDTAAKATFLQVSVGAYVGSPSVYSYTGGVNTAVGVTSGQRDAGIWVRVVILGATQWVYYSTSSSSTPPTSWTSLQSYTLTLPVGALGVGHLICSTNTSNNTTGGVSWFGWMSYTPGVTLPWSGGIVPTGSEFQATAYATTGDTVPLIKSWNFRTKTTPNITALRLTLADAINRLPGDTATWTFSCTGSASANPGAATTFQAAASLTLKQPGTDTAADAAGYQYWALHAICASSGNTQPGSIDTALVRLVV